MAAQRFRLALDRPAVGHSIIQALEKSRHSKTIFQARLDSPHRGTNCRRWHALFPHKSRAHTALPVNHYRAGEGRLLQGLVVRSPIVLPTWEWLTGKVRRVCERSYNRDRGQGHKSSRGHVSPTCTWLPIYCAMSLSLSRIHYILYSV